MLFYEIIRIDNQPAYEEFETIKKMVRRGWTRKAIDFLSDWDYGNENIDTAMALGTMRDTILDNKSTCDHIIATKGNYTLCASQCPSGLYEAYYLVSSISEEKLAKL